MFGKDFVFLIEFGFSIVNLWDIQTRNVYFVRPGVTTMAWDILPNAMFDKDTQSLAIPAVTVNCKC